ncbi:GreA/GreB family elongation factor [Ekhidna sp.]|jgi:transcription elongation factor GreB|uniref:GreA/GreB family elongation factor n=1 Tax=Ekhidna sp. TaxID=2608089 RepID=UPI0032EAD6EF
MSRAFVNEDNQEEAPIIPPRAPLPDGAPNYVTGKGLDLLKKEREQLLEEIEQLHSLEDEKDKRYKMQLVKGKLALLEGRINSARLPEVSESEMHEVRFGAKVTLQFTKENSKQSFQLVGVDEANVKEQKIAFTAPIAKAITGKSVGDKAVLQLGKETRSMEIVSIDYE